MDNLEFGVREFEGLSLSKYEKEVTRIRACNVAKNSRLGYIYRCSSARFLEWLYKRKPEILTNSCKTSLDGCVDESERNEKLREILDGAPIMFDIMTARDFMTWIVTLRKSDGTRLSASSFDGHTSGLFKIFRDFGFTICQRNWNQS